MELLSQLSPWLLFGLFALGACAFTLSTISGGGGALMQIPILNFLIGTSQTAPVINLGTFISRPHSHNHLLEAHSLEGLLVLCSFCNAWSCICCLAFC